MPRRGFVKIAGRVVAGDEGLSSPLTSVDCQFYAVDMVEWNNGVNYPFLRATSAAPFAIEDDTGVAWIYPSGGMFFLDEASFREGHSVDNFRTVAAYVHHQGKNMVDELGLRRSVGWKERWLAVGDAVVVMGHVQWELAEDEQPLYRDAPQRLALRSAKAKPLVLELVD